MSYELIGFPGGTIFEKPVRMPIVFSGAGAVAISKPAGVSAEKILSALCERPSTRLHIEKPQIVFYADEEASGIVLFADKACKVEYEAWKNTQGSFLIEQTFLFLAKPLNDLKTPSHHRAKVQGEFSCTLPVAKHFSGPRALISHKTGKKSCTIFVREESFPPWELWRAQTTFPRFHQIRLHAAESGIPIVGEKIYGEVPTIKISDLRANNRLNKGEDKAFYADLCLHLANAKILFPKNAPQNFPTEITISAPLPSGFESLLKKLRTKTLPSKL